VLANRGRAPAAVPVGDALVTATRATIRDAVVILLAVALLAWLSALADPEPALPHCAQHSTSSTRCAP
jgi:hypothetical protein